MTVPCEKFFKKTVTIVNARGLHARAAAKFVQTVERHRADVKVSKDGKAVGGLSIMSLLMLSASKGCQIDIVTSGEEAEPALFALASLVETGFGEEV